MSDIYTENTLHDKMWRNALADKDRQSFDFCLVDGTDIFDVDKNDLEDALHLIIQFHAIRYDKSMKDATNEIFANLRYIVGYYGEKEASAWREWLSDVRENRKWF